MNYYNENDPKTAAWLRELIAQGLIPKGEVDERSIEDVTTTSLIGYTQHHFFAGIGGWSQALKLAGWPDTRPVWTGSCPCQPFSAAGKRKGTTDERHLWPAWHWLIKEYHPEVVFGEQVASKDGIAWLDIVSTDLEGESYAVAPLVFPACGVGAPHKRERLWFVADSRDPRLPGWPLEHARQEQQAAQRSGDAHSMEHTESIGRIEWRTEPSGRGSDAGRSLGSAGDTERARSWWNARAIPGTEAEIRVLNGHIADVIKSSGSTFWSDAEWIYCRDEKYRAIKPGTFPLAHGVSDRVVKLRGIGNAIVPQVAAQVIGAYMEIQNV